MDDGQSLEIPGGSAYEIPSGHDASVVGDEPFVTLEWTSANVVGIGIDGGNERILATVLFTDIVNSTATLEAMGDARWRDVLGEHNRRMRDRSTATAAGRSTRPATGSWPCSTAPREPSAAARRWPRTRPRWASRSASASTPARSSSWATGRVASRCTPRPGSSRAAGASEVLVSETTKALIEGSGLVLEDAGTHELKGISGERRLYRVTPQPRA